MTNELFCDQQWFRANGGLSLLAGSPLTMFSVTDAGSKVLDAIEDGTTLPANHTALTQRLLAAGAIHPHTNHSVALNDITVVIPAFIRNEIDLNQLRAAVASVSELNVIVVDDASPVPIQIPHVTVIRRESNGGPAASRNTGISEVTTSFVVCIDSDVTCTADALQRLCSVVNDDTVVLAAPRIVTENKKTFLSEYESLRSPLNLGESASVVRPLSRVSYVPAAVVAARTEQLRDHCRFDESMRVGEDVDLVWRIAESGGTVRYVPEVECAHEARPTWGGLLRQRFQYGSSTATLNQRHPRSASPLRANGILLLPALALLAGYLTFAALLAAPTALYFAVTLRSTRVPLLTRMRVTWTGFTSTLALLASAIRRTWWPLFVVGAVFIQPLFFMVMFSVLAPAGLGIVRSKTRYPGEYFLMRILDDAAYGLGVWAGAIKCRNCTCLLPVITFRRTSRNK